jgi:hypothetical protein
MTPYQTFRLTEYPDVADIKIEARNTRTGGVFQRPTVKHDVRRHLKRADRARSLREEIRIEREAEEQEQQEFEAEEIRLNASYDPRAWNEYAEENNWDYWQEFLYALPWDYEDW